MYCLNTSLPQLHSCLWGQTEHVCNHRNLRMQQLKTQIQTGPVDINQFCCLFCRSSKRKIVKKVLWFTFLPWDVYVPKNDLELFLLWYFRAPENCNSQEITYAINASKKPESAYLILCPSTWLGCQQLSPTWHPYT